MQSELFRSEMLTPSGHINRSGRCRDPVAGDAQGRTSVVTAIPPPTEGGHQTEIVPGGGNRSSPLHFALPAWRILPGCCVPRRCVDPELISKARKVRRPRVVCAITLLGSRMGSGTAPVGCCGLGQRSRERTRRGRNSPDLCNRDGQKDRLRIWS